MATATPVPRHVQNSQPRPNLIASLAARHLGAVPSKLLQRGIDYTAVSVGLLCAETIGRPDDDGLEVAVGLTT